MGKRKDKKRKKALKRARALQISLARMLGMVIVRQVVADPRKPSKSTETVQ